MTGIPLMIAALMGGYLLGSVPFGLVITKLAGLDDIRTTGSGNIGATNVLRTGRKGLALATLLFDGGKGAIAAIIFLLLSSDIYQAQLAALIAGVAAVFGHNFPVWLKFKGGKGVATTLGVLIATGWPVGIAACLTWALVAAITRYSSLAALIAIGLSPLYAYFLASPAHVTAAAILAMLSVIRHRQNISRLQRGEESKIGKTKDAVDVEADTKTADDQPPSQP